MSFSEAFECNYSQHSNRSMNSFNLLNLLKLMPSHAHSMQVVTHDTAWHGNFIILVRMTFICTCANWVTPNRLIDIWIRQIDRSGNDIMHDFDGEYSPPSCFYYPIHFKQSNDVISKLLIQKCITQLHIKCWSYPLFKMLITHMSCVGVFVLVLLISVHWFGDLLK